MGNNFKGGGGRMDRQNKQNALAKAKDDAKGQELTGEKASNKLESAKYWADASESYLERMRNGFAEGAKLHYDSFRTRAALTTGSIVVLLGLSKGVLPVDQAYSPLLWLCCALLLFSMVASLKTMDSITTSVFVALTNEDAPTDIRDGKERIDAEHLKEEREKSNKMLTRRSRIASGSFVAGLGTFVVYVALPPLVGLIGIVWALVALGALLVTGAVLYIKF